MVDGDLPHSDATIIIPLGVIAAKLDLQALQLISLDPVFQKDGMPILGLVSGEVLCFKWVQASDQMPCNEGARRRFEKEIRRKGFSEWGVGE